MRLAEFARRYGARDKKKRKSREEREEDFQRYKEGRKTVGTGTDVSKEVRGWVSLVRKFS